MRQFNHRIIDEVHQFYVPEELQVFLMLAIDSFGAIAMQSIINIYEWIKNNSKS